MRAPHLAGFSLALAMVAVAALGVAADEPSAINIVEFRTWVSGDKGVVRCGLFGERGWLTKPIRSATAKIQGKSALCTFQRVPPGTLAASAFHDENSNGKLDTNFLGMPTEEYCASRNARGTFGPPSFDNAKFGYRGGTKRIEAHMK